MIMMRIILYYGCVSDAAKRPYVGNTSQPRHLLSGELSTPKHIGSDELLAANGATAGITDRRQMSLRSDLSPAGGRKARINKQ